MNTLNLTGKSGQTTGLSQPSWRGLYEMGIISAALYVVMIVIPLVLIFAAPQPPLTGGAALLEYIAAHKAVYITELVCFVGMSLPALVVFLALYRALERLDSSYAAIGALIAIASETISLAFSSSPPSLHTGLLNLSNQYAVASGAGRASLATAAEGLMALSNMVNAAGILTALGILILSLVMLKGSFWRNAGYLGVLTGALGIVSETFREGIGAGYFVFGLLLPIWFAAVGWKLYRLEKTTDEKLWR